ncbi:hypothetical protein BKA63DRAFT_98163 [Paraphoma chrysanthemicola]|nr:hypothetical protein BKA63DRAFT_98163 [Paraphoma chrysanthemicola]
MLHQSRDAFSAVRESDKLFAMADGYRRSCDDELSTYRATTRRSGFEEKRSFDQGLLIHLDEKLDVCSDRLTQCIAVLTDDRSSATVQARSFVCAPPQKPNACLCLTAG